MDSVKFKAEKKANLAAASSSFSIAIDTSQIIKKIIPQVAKIFRYRAV